MSSGLKPLRASGLFSRRTRTAPCCWRTSTGSVSFMSVAEHRTVGEPHLRKRFSPRLRRPRGVAVTRAEHPVAATDGAVRHADVPERGRPPRPIDAAGRCSSSTGRRTGTGSSRPSSGSPASSSRCASGWSSRRSRSRCRCGSSTPTSTSRTTSAAPACPRRAREAQLLELLEPITMAPLDRARPLWEFTLVEGLEDGTAAWITQGEPRHRRRHRGPGAGAAVVRHSSGPAAARTCRRRPRPTDLTPERPRAPGPRRGPATALIAAAAGAQTAARVADRLVRRPGRTRRGRRRLRPFAGSDHEGPRSSRRRCSAPGPAPAPAGAGGPARRPEGGQQGRRRLDQRRVPRRRLRRSASLPRAAGHAGRVGPDRHPDQPPHRRRRRRRQPLDRRPPGAAGRRARPRRAHPAHPRARARGPPGAGDRRVEPARPDRRPAAPVVAVVGVSAAAPCPTCR